MGCSTNGSSVPGSKLSGQVALVSYINDPLGSFLDSLCRELVPGAKPHAHISILPPRPLSCEPTCASQEIARLTEEFQPFDVTLGDVEVFPVSHVIYVSIAHGHEHLRRLHSVLNHGQAQYRECFPYHPHVTLAQELSLEAVPGKLELARKRWRGSEHDHVVHINTLSFVQNLNSDWVDLQELPLGNASAVLV